MPPLFHAVGETRKIPDTLLAFGGLVRAARKSAFTRSQRRKARDALTALSRVKLLSPARRTYRSAKRDAKTSRTNVANRVSQGEITLSGVIPPYITCSF